MTRLENPVAGRVRHKLTSILTLLLILTAGSATAQNTTGEPEPPVPVQVDHLVRLLADPAVAAWLQARSGADAPRDPIAAPARDTDATADMGMLQAAVTSAKKRLETLLSAAAALPAETDYALTVWQLEMSHDDMLRSLSFVALFLLAGLFGESLFRSATRRVRRRITADAGCDAAVRLGRTLARGLLDLLAAGVFALFSLCLFFLFDWQPIVELLVFSLLVAFLILRLAHIITTFLLAPRILPLRLIPVGDGIAKRLHGWILALTAAAALGGLFLSALDDLGFFPTSSVLIWAAISLIVTLLAILLVWRTRRTVTAYLRTPSEGDGSDEPTDATASGGQRFRSTLADLWPPAATLYLLLTWGAAVLGAHALAWTLVILALVPLADAVLQAIVANACAAAQTPACRHARTMDGEDIPSELDGPSTFPVARRAVRAVIMLTGMVTLVEMWGYDVSAMAQAGGTTAAVMEAVFNVVVTVLLADLAWYATKTAIDGKLVALGGGAATPGESGEGGGVAGPGARQRTLLPLVRNFIMIVLAVMTTLIVLSSIGVDIGPLLAGAGVVGLAIGFGAQTLVRDIVAGVFFLLEDAFRVGEYVEVGELRGTVETISLRSMKLRHHRGQVHTLPFGEIPSLTNYSRDWIIMKLEFRVPFDTDLVKFKKLVKKVGAELAEHPEYGQHILEPVKSQGVRRMEEFNMVVGVKFMTKPGEQWVIRRETYQRILTAMDAAGIRLASRHVQVEVTGANGTAPLPEAIKKAATAAAEPLIAPIGPPLPVPDTP